MNLLCSTAGAEEYGRMRVSEPMRRRPRAAPSAVSERRRTEASPALVELQRQAGNAAVTKFVQRDRASGDRRRPGERWPWGPITARKSVQHDLSTWVHWIGVVETAYGPDKQAVLQRLRRLYYSSHSGAAGAKFDQAIAEQAGAGSGPPLDTLQVGEITLDGLYETDTVRTLTGDILDPAHILAAIDVRLSGTTTKGAVAEAAYDAPWTGIVTWTGDLASWFLEWSQQIRNRPGAAGDATLWQRVGATKVAKDDLLGDMDAQVLAARSVRRSTPESVKAEKRIVRDENISRELTKPVSRLIGEYYGFGMGRDKPTEAEGRFPLFVASAVPKIPHRTVAGVSGTKGSVELSDDAEDAIFTAVRNTARLFVNQGTSDRSDPVGTYPERIRDIARRVATFLATGLKTGDAPWP